MLLVLFSFGRSKEKEPKRKLADCTSAAKIASLLTKRRKTVASLTLWCGALNAITLQSFHAAPVRSVSLALHCCARCGSTTSVCCAQLFSDLSSGALIKSGKFLEKRAAPIRPWKGRLAALPKTWVIFSGRDAVGVSSFASFLRDKAKKRMIKF